MGQAKRRRVIAGNWKMYKTQAEARAFFAAFLPLVRGAMHCDIVVAPPFTAIAAAVEAAQNSNIAIGAQNVFWEKEGAFTGVNSRRRRTKKKNRYVIIGHSERRQFFGGTRDQVEKKNTADASAVRTTAPRRG